MFKEEIEALMPEIIALRRDFHANPELGFKEERTAGIVEKYLQQLGIETKRCAGTGVVGLLKGTSPGKTLLMRADIDALPVTEQTGLPFASKNPGVMHACGHDGHTSVLMGVANVLSKHRDSFKGNIKFVFQPNEEDAGAYKMVEEGVMENPKVDAGTGFHLWTPIPTGKVGIAAGPVMASSYYFNMVITGKGGHGGSPHEAINPIEAGVSVMQAIKSMLINEYVPTKPTLITFCNIHAGRFPIIVPDTIEISGSLRCLDHHQKAVQTRFREVAEQICKAYRCTLDLNFQCGNELLDNDPGMAQLATEVATELVGQQNIISSGIQVMGGDDFSDFSALAPSIYTFVGTGNAEKRTNISHHNPCFDIDEDSLAIALQLQVDIALKYLA